MESIAAIGQALGFTVVLAGILAGFLLIAIIFWKFMTSAHLLFTTAQKALIFANEWLDYNTAMLKKKAISK